MRDLRSNTPTIIILINIFIKNGVNRSHKNLNCLIVKLEMKGLKE